MKILVINGPNLNLLGKREPEVYGSLTLEAINAEIQEKSDELNFDCSFFQSNGEGEIIDALHKAAQETEKGKVDGIILNAGAYTHYSYAIRDAISAIGIPVIEVHISNVHSREEFRHTSVISPVCKGVIAGFGKTSYILALLAFKELLK